MARKVRVEFAGALYHVLDRGDQGEAIFRDDEDRERFLQTLGETCARTGWRVHAWVLMDNHYHLMVETPEANLVAGMRWFQTTLTIRYNRRHRITGRLFQGRYKAVVVDPEEGGYSVPLSDYIHLNPVRSGLVGAEDRLVDYRWSSFPCYVRGAGRPVWFEADRVLGELGLRDDAEGRREYARRMRNRAEAELRGEETSASAELRRGWYLGSESFRKRMLRLMDAAGAKVKRRSPRGGQARPEHGDDEARRLLKAGLEYFGLQTSELSGLKKGDERKLAVAAVVRRRTSVANRWLADTLALGHISRVSQALRRAETLKLAEKLERALLP